MYPLSMLVSHMTCLANIVHLDVTHNKNGTPDLFAGQIVLHRQMMSDVSCTDAG